MRSAMLTALAAFTLTTFHHPSAPVPVSLPGDLRPPLPVRAATAETPIAVEEPTLNGAWRFIVACESGDWVGGVPQLGTHRWDYGLEFDHGDDYQGAFNMAANTWDAYRDDDMPDHAGMATPQDQLEVAERVLAVQGWAAWPTCARMAGLR